MAVARHTFKESLRKSVLLILVLFALVLILTCRFFPVIEEQMRVKMVESVCLRTITGFSVIAAIFLAASSLPGDFDQRRIYHIVTKPITRMQFLTGKILGFCLVMGMLVLAMGIVSDVLIRITARTSSRAPLVAQTRIPQTEHFVSGGLGEKDYRWDASVPCLDVVIPFCFGVGHRWELTVPREAAEQSPVPVRLRFALPSKMQEAAGAIRERMPAKQIVARLRVRQPVTEQYTDVSATLVTVSPRGMSPFNVAELRVPPALISAGRKTVFELVGTEPELPSARHGWFPRGMEPTWRYVGLDPERLPADALKVAAHLDLSTGHLAWPDRELAVTLVARVRLASGELAEYPCTRRVRARKQAVFSFSKSCLREGRDLDIVLKEVEEPYFAGYTSRELPVQLRGTPRLFEWAFLKAILLVFLQVVLVIVAAVTASVCLSAPVSVLIAFALYFCGQLVQLMHELLRATGGASSLIFSAAHDHGAEQVEPVSQLPAWLAEHLETAARGGTRLFVALCPDLRRLIPSHFILTGADVPARMIGDGLLQLLGYGSVCFVIAMVLFRRREFA